MGWTQQPHPGMSLDPQSPEQTIRKKNMTVITQRVVALDELASLVNERLGVSRWHVITQEQINLFADATGDHQWLHVDPERARTGPFGTTVAHGYLTLSLGPMLYLS